MQGNRRSFLKATGLAAEKQVWRKAGDKITTRVEKLGDLNFTLT
jgi:hypothetical protein